MITWAYIAGFFDGEGCLPYGYDTVALYQSDRRPLDKMAEFLQSNNVACSVMQRKTPRKTNFLIIEREACLRMNGRGAVTKFLTKVLPYLQTKKRVAVQDYLRFRRIFPPMTLSQSGKLGGRARHDKHRERLT